MKTNAIKSIAKKVTILCATVTIAAASFSMTTFAGLIGSDSVSSSIYGTPCAGSLSVYDTYATVTTTYSRSGSNITVDATIDATYRANGVDKFLHNYQQTSGGGSTARVDIDLSEYPLGVFFTVNGMHEVRNYTDGMLLQAGHWLTNTKWVR